tara:strand:+ start:4820 stop:5452 length:633 start_codon:yes stop_codon:yes gene_type:complete
MGKATIKTAKEKEVMPKHKTQLRQKPSTINIYTSETEYRCVDDSKKLRPHEMSYTELKTADYEISARGDFDKDGVPNAKDCRPLDPNRHFVGAIARGVGRGVVGVVKAPVRGARGVYRGARFVGRGVKKGARGADYIGRGIKKGGGWVKARTTTTTSTSYTPGGEKHTTSWRGDDGRKSHETTAQIMREREAEKNQRDTALLLRQMRQRR